MRYTPFLLCLPLLWLTACNNAESYVATADSVTMANNLSPLTSASRKMVHTADIRCRVNDVYAATTKLEDIVRSLDGIVADSKIQNDITATNKQSYKPDSLKLVQTYSGTAHLTLRVPAPFIDSVVKQVHTLSGFIDTRSLRQQDMTLAYLSNAMRNESDGVAPPAVPAKDGSSNLEVNTKETKIIKGKEDDVVDRRIENLQLLDDVNYATLHIELYQPEMVDVQIVANPSYVAVTPFITGISSALTDGLQFFKILFVFMLRLWPLWIIGVAAFKIYKLVRKRRIIIKGA